MIEIDLGLLFTLAVLVVMNVFLFAMLYIVARDTWRKR